MFIGIEAAHANKEKRTGVENACFYLLQNLKKVIPPEHRVVLYTPTPLSSRPESCELRSNSLRDEVEGSSNRNNALSQLPPNWQEKILPWPFKKLWSQIRLSWELFRRPPDVFFAPGQLIPFFTPRRTVVLIHDSAFVRHPRAYGRLSRWYLSWMNKRIVKRAEKIIVTAEFNKRELMDIYKISPDKIAVVPLAIDKELFVRPGEEKILAVKEKYDIKKPYLFFLGRLEEKKNIGFLVEAWEKMREEGKELMLILAGGYGKGRTGKQVKETIEGSKFLADIKIIKGVPNKDLPGIYAGAEVFVFPSIYEGFGLPVLEAMACGTPVLAARAAALPEVIGEAGELFTPGDRAEFIKKIERILTDEEYRQKLIAAGHARAAEFDWEKTARGVGDVVSSVCLSTKK